MTALWNYARNTGRSESGVDADLEQNPLLEKPDMRFRLRRDSKI